MTFQFDTTGTVDCVRPLPNGMVITIAWPDLSPFAQGYVVAMFADEQTHHVEAEEDRFLGFSDLAPETLARIIADCESLLHFVNEYDNTAEDGARFWNGGERMGTPSAFPPLSVLLGDDGKVRLQDTPTMRGWMAAETILEAYRGKNAFDRHPAMHDKTEAQAGESPAALPATQYQFSQSLNTRTEFAAARLGVKTDDLIDTLGVFGLSISDALKTLAFAEKAMIAPAQNARQRNLLLQIEDILLDPALGYCARIAKAREFIASRTGAE